MDNIWQIRRATADDFESIVALIRASANWLGRYKGTDQWAKPWPDEVNRDERIRQGIKDDRTWIVEDNGALVATITYREFGNDMLWTPGELRDPAVYISRLIVDRAYAGRRIGASLIDWAGRRGWQEWGARWIRLDVWTNNYGLHRYYRSLGFMELGVCAFEKPWDYPSAALFQKLTTDVGDITAERFKEVNYQAHAST